MILKCAAIMFYTFYYICIHAYIKMSLVFFADEERYHREQGPGENGLLHWLTSSELLHTLSSSSSELMETINQVKGRDKGISS
jgi:hypothetical protein